MSEPTKCPVCTYVDAEADGALCEFCEEPHSAEQARAVVAKMMERARGYLGTEHRSDPSSAHNAEDEAMRYALYAVAKFGDGVLREIAEIGLALAREPSERFPRWYE